MRAPYPSIVSTNKSRPWHGRGNKSDWTFSNYTAYAPRTALKAPVQRCPLTAARMAYKTSHRDVFIAGEGGNDVSMYTEGMQKRGKSPSIQ